jgi:hypothetical protein
LVAILIFGAAAWGTAASAGPIDKIQPNQPHTPLIRAVDGETLPDPTPDYGSFTGETLEPTVQLQHPVEAGREFTAPPDFVMHWTDPVGDGTSIQPDSSRWVLIPSAIDIEYPDRYTSFPDSLYTLPERFEWSPWQDWDALDGRSAVIQGLKRIGEEPGSGFYIFAVQAKDEAGAITPVFDWKTPGGNNVALIRVSGAVGPILTVEESNVGTFNFVGGSRPVRVEAAAGQRLRFRWSADASRYGGAIEAYRYGWDVIDPNDDASWDVDWGPTEQMTERSLQEGTHTLRVQCRDNIGAITEALIEIGVIVFTGERGLLFVDDAPEITSGEEQRVDILWQTVLTSIAQEAGVDFDLVRDTYDVTEKRLEPPSTQLLFQYATIVWDVQPNDTRTSALRQLALFFDPFAERNQNHAATFSPLKAYLAAGGKLWVSGFRPASHVWPDERVRGPVNVTNWDDPIEPHPTIDSVGTSSWLYKHGVEMFDVGAAIEIDRRTLAHFCQGFETARPEAPALQVDPVSWAVPSGQPDGLMGRPNIEIYNMPEAMAQQVPPLMPPPDLVQVLYLYVSGVPRDEMAGVVYPQTADGQPVFILARSDAGDAFFSRALCGFRPHLLTPDSHLQLAQHVLLREMGLVPTPILLQSFAARLAGNAVQVEWRVADWSDPASFRLRAASDDEEWTVPHAPMDSHGSAPTARTFSATDDSQHLVPGRTVAYSLYRRDRNAAWALLGQEEVTLATSSRPSHLGKPRPNPFNPRTTIPIELASTQRLRILIYSLNGRRVRTLVDAIRPRGSSHVVWDGTDDRGRAVASGLYVLRMEAGGATMNRKLVLLR